MGDSGGFMSNYEKLYETAIKLYLGNHILKEIQNNKDDFLKTFYDVKELSYLVIDLKPFTGNMPSIELQDLIKYYNNYIDTISEIIIMNNGFIESLHGDSFTVIFGIINNNHAQDACNCALDCVNSLSRLNKSLSINDFYKLGIGIATGMGALGNYGSKYKLKYSCMSDTLNFASRLQGLTKAFNVNIIISDKTKSLLNNTCNTKELQIVQIKGKEGSFTIHELC